MMGSGCFVSGQAASERTFTGTWWGLVLSILHGRVFCEVNSANACLTCHCCSQPGRSQSGWAAL